MGTKEGFMWKAAVVLLSTSQLALSAGSKPKVEIGQTFKLRNTYYYVVPEDMYPLTQQEVPVLAKDGSTLAKVNSSFKRAMDIEGTGKLMNGKVLNYIAKGEDGSIRYAFTRHPFGRAVGDCPLFVYHSAAVDPKVVPLGTDRKSVV